MSDKQTTDLPPPTLKVVRKWLAYQHGMPDNEIDTVLSGHATPGSKIGRLRQEAIDVAGFVEGLSLS